MTTIHKAIFHYDAHNLMEPLLLWSGIEAAMDRLELREHFINAYMNDVGDRGTLVVVMRSRDAALMLKLAMA